MNGRFQLERVAALYEPFNRGDLEGLLALVTDDVEWRSPPEGVPGLERVYRGHAELRRWFVDLREGWERMEVLPVQVDEVAPEVVLVRIQMRGRAGGIETEMPMWHLVRFRGQKVASLEPFLDRERALAAAQTLKTERPG